MKYVITLLFFIVSTNLYAKSIVISLGGLEINTLNLAQLKKITTVHNIKIYSNKERRIQEYRAFKLVDLLNTLFPSKWQNYGFIKVQSKTGYTPKIKISQLSTRDAYLAYERADGQKFQIIDSTTTSLVDLAPFYLIWARDNKLSRLQKKKYRWIYQVQSLTISSTTLEKKLSKGEDLYNNFCLRCHSIANTKKKFGPSFFKSNIVQKIGFNTTMKYINNPNSFKSFSKMPPFPQARDKRERSKNIKRIVLFLQKAGAIHRIKNPSIKVIDTVGLKTIMNQD